MSIRLNRVVAQATIDDKDCRGGLAIHLSQPSNSLVHWKFQVFAQTDEGNLKLGIFTTSLPLQLVEPDIRSPSRVVAIANCPGAKSFTLEISAVNPEDFAPDVDSGTLVSVCVGDCFGPPGVVRVDERYAHYSGVDGAIVLAPGDRVVGWSAVGGPAGATVDIGTVLSPIVIPPNVTVAGSTGGNLSGPVTIIFTDTLSYLVEVARSF
jgi:hypothetical protein